MGRNNTANIARGTKGNPQITTENFELQKMLEDQVAIGDIKLMDKNDNFSKFISKRNDVDTNGYFDVIAHGSENRIQIYHNGKNYLVDWRTLNNILKRNTEYKGQPIRLLSCNTGARDDGFAQNLANKLGIDVLAPTKYVFAYNNGKYIVANKKKNNTIALPDLNDVGEFVVFKPRRKK